MSEYLEITNWEKFNPRSDYHCHWFRMEVGLFGDVQFSSFNPTDWVVFLYVLDRTCFKQGEAWQLDFDFCATQCRIKTKEFRAGIEKLKQLHIVRCTARNRSDSFGAQNESVQCTPLTIHNEHNEHNNTIQGGVGGGSPPVETEVSTPPSFCLSDIWNEHCGALPKCREVTDKRKVLIRARLKASHDKAYWVDVVQIIASVPFTTGDNDRGWKANFDWFLRPDTHIKVMEGTYEKAGSKPSVAKKPELVGYTTDGVPVVS